ncbi:MAG: Holliday junction branch migration protein RuvA [Bacteroidales bacterium]|nr:Holliday junction branch migration protein RuvA [Candidatus Hennigimonas equi]
MIDYITGTITELTPTEVVIENGGIGYIALISLQTYSQLDHRNDAKVFVHHILREDEELYYGFASKDERELFRLLISVSGVGAATARMMLSSLTCDEIRGAIIGEDVNKIKSVKGIGLKSAQRLIIELKDKITKGAGAESTAIFAAQSEVSEEAVTALVMLGFTKAAVGKAVSAVLKKDPSAPVESIIKQALQML